MGVFLARALHPSTAWTPPTALAHPDRLTVAAGSACRGRLPHDTAMFLADRLGGAFAEFPGGHLGTLDHPAEFADVVTATFRAGPDTSA